MHQINPSINKSLPWLPKLKLPISHEARNAFAALCLRYGYAGNHVEPWVPVSRIGPLIVVGHHSPDTAPRLSIPHQLQKRVRISKEDYDSIIGQIDIPSTLETESPFPDFSETPAAVIKWLAKYGYCPAKETSSIEQALRLSDAGKDYANILPADFALALKVIRENASVVLFDDIQIDSTIRGEIAPEIAERHKAVPFSKFEDTVFVAYADTTVGKYAFEDDLKAREGRYRDLHFVNVLTSPLAHKAALEAAYNPNFRSDSAVHLGGGEVLGEDIEIDLKQVSTEFNWNARGNTPLDKLRWILFKAIQARASDINIGYFEGQCRIRLKESGSWHPLHFGSKADHLGLANWIRTNSRGGSLGELDHQEGRFSCRLTGRTIDFRVAGLRSHHGTTEIFMRVLDSAKGLETLNDLHLSQHQRRLLLEALQKPHGLFLSTGRTGSGKSTTLYACLHELNAHERNILTVEDPVERTIQGITQVAAKTSEDPDQLARILHAKQGFAGVSERFLRCAPDIIMIQELRDQATFNAALANAMTGHLVLSTIHSNDCLSAVARLASFGAPPEHIADCLEFLQGQRLVKKLCRCSREEPLTKDLRNVFEAARVLVPSSQTEIHVKGPGCEDCRYTGYKGQIAVMEMTPVSNALRELIYQRASHRQLVRQARREGYTSMHQEGLRRALEGVTSLEQVHQLKDERTCPDLEDGIV